MRDDFEKLLQEEMKNPEFQKEWNLLEAEFNIVQAMLDARKKRNLTQSELAKKTGINQADISKLENGNGNPTLAILHRLAEGMDMQLKIEFVPKTHI